MQSMKHSKMQLYFTVGGGRDHVCIRGHWAELRGGSVWIWLNAVQAYNWTCVQETSPCVSNQNASLLSQDSGTVAIWLYLLKDYVTGQKFSNNEEHLQFWKVFKSKESLCQTKVCGVGEISVKGYTANWTLKLYRNGKLFSQYIFVLLKTKHVILKTLSKKKFKKMRKRVRPKPV